MPDIQDKAQYGDAGYDRNMGGAMTLEQFITDNRQELDAAINRVLCHVPRTASCHCPKSGTDHNHEPDRLNDRERRLWILNDEGLYSLYRLIIRDVSGCE